MGRNKYRGGDMRQPLQNERSDERDKAWVDVRPQKKRGRRTGPATQILSPLFYLKSSASQPSHSNQTESHCLPYEASEPIYCSFYSASQRSHPSHLELAHDKPPPHPHPAPQEPRPAHHARRPQRFSSPHVPSHAAQRGRIVPIDSARASPRWPFQSSARLAVGSRAPPA